MAITYEDFWYMSESSLAKLGFYYFDALILTSSQYSSCNGTAKSQKLGHHETSSLRSEAEDSLKLHNPGFLQSPLSPSPMIFHQPRLDLCVQGILVWHVSVAEA